MSLFETHPVGLADYVRVQNREPFISVFEWLYGSQEQSLYNHSPIFPFSYLNKGQMKLYLNKDFTASTNNKVKNKILPVVKQFEHTLEHKPLYFLHCPIAEDSVILSAVEHLDELSSAPVVIADVTNHFALNFIERNPTWEKVKTSDDVIQHGEALAKLTGRNFSSLRNTIKHVKNDINPEVQPLNPRNANDAICVFERWKVTQGLKYFRVTIGRDIRLIEEYADKLDFYKFFGYVYYVNNVPKAVSFGTRSYMHPEWGVDVTCKADTSCKGLADFAFIHLCSEMYKKGIKYVNDSGGTGKVMLNKRKFNPLKTIPCFDLKRKT